MTLPGGAAASSTRAGSLGGVPKVGEEVPGTFVAGPAMAVVTLPLGSTVVGLGVEGLDYDLGGEPGSPATLNGLCGRREPSSARVSRPPTASREGGEAFTYRRFRSSKWGRTLSVRGRQNRQRRRRRPRHIRRVQGPPLGLALRGQVGLSERTFAVCGRAYPQNRKVRPVLRTILLGPTRRASSTQQS